MRHLAYLRNVRDGKLMPVQSHISWIAAGALSVLPDRPVEQNVCPCRPNVLKLLHAAMLGEEGKL